MSVCLRAESYLGLRTARTPLCGAIGLQSNYEIQLRIAPTGDRPPCDLLGIAKSTIVSRYHHQGFLVKHPDGFFSLHMLFIGDVASNVKIEEAH